jgi:uncharacterized membrane protein
MIEALHGLFVTASDAAVLLIDIMALIAIMAGTVQAFIAALIGSFRGMAGHELRFIFIRYARWLVAGLTFQLAADIIESAIAPSWEEIGQLAAIAVIRTFLNFFLERDLAEVRERQTEPANETT